MLTIKYCLWHLVSIPIDTLDWVFQNLTFICPLLFFLCGLSLPLILKSPSKTKCITLQIIYTLIILQKLTWVISGVHQWKICPWRINYFNRAADRKINTCICMQNYYPDLGAFVSSGWCECSGKDFSGRMVVSQINDCLSSTWKL